MEFFSWLTKFTCGLWLALAFHRSGMAFLFKKWVNQPSDTLTSSSAGQCSCDNWQLFRHCVEQTPFNRFPLLSHFSEFGAQFLFYQGVMYQTKGTCSRFRCLLLIFFFLINPVTDLHVIKLKFIGVRLEFLFYFRITIQHKKSFFFVYVRSTLYWSHFVPPALTVMMF